MDDFLDNARQFLLLFCSPLIGCGSYFCVVKPIENNYRIRKDFKVKNVTTAQLPIEVIRKVDDLKEDEILKKYFGDVILEFVNVVKENISEDNLAIFYNNISSLDSRTKNYGMAHKLIGSVTTGAYSLRKNVITLDNSNFASKLTVYHELFHASSSIFIPDDGIEYSGFYQYNDGKRFGEGINEGYTQYLTEKYFNDKNNAESYLFETKVAEKVELLVGKDKMESLYFKANLKGLIDCLKVYRSEKEVYEFINSLDFVNKYFHDGNLTSKSYKLIEEKMRDVYSFLIKSFYMKNAVDLANHGVYEVNVMDLIEKTSACISDYPLTYQSKKQKLNVYDTELVEQAIDEVISELDADCYVEEKEKSK